MAQEKRAFFRAYQENSASTTRVNGAEPGRHVFLFRTPRRLPPALEKSAALGYADVGLFFISVLFLALGLRVAVHLGLLSPANLDRPPLAFQVAVSLFLIGSLYWTIKLRHGGKVWPLLGWTLPTGRYLAVALLGGTGLALAVDLIARATTPTTHLIHIRDLLVLDVVLGPVVEESFFRGCLLPVVARTTDPKIAILATAALFATLHPVRTLVQWACFTGTGVAYGWIRTKSGSTAASTLMHAAYNVTLFFCQIP